MKAKDGQNLRAAIYARVSTAAQAGQDKDSLPSQVRDLTTIAQANGWQIVGEYQDPGITGETVEGRPALMRLLAEVEAGKVDVVMVRALDRLSRDYVANAEILTSLRKGNVKLWAAGAIQDMSTVQGELITHILGVIGAGDKRALVQRMQRGRRAAVERGRLAIVARPPYGYQYNLEGKKFEIVPEEAEVVQDIFRWYVEEGLGALAIVRRLADSGIPSPNCGKRGKPKVRRDRPVNPKTWKPIGGWFVRRLWGREFWCKRGWRPRGEWWLDVVRQILANPSYKGEHVCYQKSNPLVLPIPAIVTCDVWDRAQRIRDERARSGGKKRQTSEYLLAQRITCRGRSGECGLTWRCQTQQGGGGPTTSACPETRERAFIVHATPQT